MTAKDLGRIRGLAFDLDGVLIDSAPAHRAAFQEVFKAFGINTFDYSQYAGWRTREAVRDVLVRAGVPHTEETVAKAAADKSRIARELVAHQKPLAEDCMTTLSSLSSLYALALATSGSRPSVESFFEFSGAMPYFRSVLTGDDVSLAKPDPEIYSRSIERLGIEASECIVVEDAVAGVQAALAAGAQAIGVAGTTTVEALEQAGAIVVVSRLRELAEVLGIV